MKGKLRAIWLSIAAVALIASVSAPAWASKPEPYGAYTDKAEWDQKVADAKVLHAKRTNAELSDAEKKQQKEIEEAFDRADVDDLSALDKLAKKYKLVVYRPLGAKKVHTLSELRGGDVGIQSLESAVTMDLPVVGYSPTTDQVGIHGHVKWNDLGAAMSDGPSYGKADAVSIIINGIASKSYVKSWSLRTYDNGGNQTGYNTTLYSTPLTNNVWPVTLRFQESSTTIPVPRFTAYEMDMWVWTLGLTSPVEATVVYAHDWRSVELESIGANATAETSKTWTWGVGLQWNWKFGNDAWPAESGTVRF